MTEATAPYSVEPVPNQPVAPTFQQILAALQRLYPNCFPPKGAERKALKIGIHKDLQARGLPEGVSATRLRHFLGGYTKSYHYLKMLTKGGQRVDLDGNLADAVTEGHIATAKERIAAKANKAKPPALKPQAAALNALPVNSPLTEDNIVPGKLEVTIKFNELPKPIEVQAGFKFGLDCDGQTITVTLKPKHWNKLVQAAGEYQAWVAALSGKIGEMQGAGFVLAEPSLQVFEKKPKVQQGAETGAEAPAAATAPPQAASTPPPAPAPEATADTAPAPAAASPSPAKVKPAAASPSPAKVKPAAASPSPAKVKAAAAKAAAPKKPKLSLKR